MLLSLSHIDAPCLNSANALVSTSDDCINSSRAVLETVTNNPFFGSFLDAAKIDSNSRAICGSAGCKGHLDDFFAKCNATLPVSWTGHIVAINSVLYIALYTLLPCRVSVTYLSVCAL